MPNGDDKNWSRTCILIDGYRSRFGRWPKRVYLPPYLFDNLVGDILTPLGFALVSSVVELRVECHRTEIDALSAEDDDGNRIDYGDAGECEPPDIRAFDYFGHAVLRHG